MQNGEFDKDSAEALNTDTSSNSGHSPDSERDPSLVNWDEARIDIISKNGNDGLHYDKVNR
jgi:hypothetical protein